MGVDVDVYAVVYVKPMPHADLKRE